LTIRWAIIYHLW